MTSADFKPRNIGRVRYFDSDCDVLQSFYVSAASCPALMLRSLAGEPIANATVNLIASDEIPLPGNAFIKARSYEQAELREVLIRANIIGPALREIHYGYDGVATEHKLLGGNSAAPTNKGHPQ